MSDMQESLKKILPSRYWIESTMDRSLRGAVAYSVFMYILIYILIYIETVEGKQKIAIFMAMMIFAFSLVEMISSALWAILHPKSYWKRDEVHEVQYAGSIESLTVTLYRIGLTLKQKNENTYLFKYGRREDVHSQ